MLLQQNTEKFCIMCSTRTDDRLSGFSNVWADGEQFDACAVQRRDNDDRTTAAQKPDAKRVYDVLTPKAAPFLPYHSIIKRLRDGRLFRITGDSADLQTPKGSRLDLRLYPAEEWRLT